jgi:hypothetical protein
MNVDDRIKLFGMSLQMMERELDRVERVNHLELGRGPAESDQDQDYFPQFKASLRLEAANMSQHYEVFYCLERSIRDLVSEKLAAEKGANWWDNCVPASIRQNVASNIQREADAGFTQRSTAPIDYTTFGELGEIVRHNWQSFGDTLNSEKAFSKIMTNLNLLRGPIAHCCALADDEVVRLKLALKDWFRLME